MWRSLGAGSFPQSTELENSFKMFCVPFAFVSLVARVRAGDRCVLFSAGAINSDDTDE